MGLFNKDQANEIRRNEGRMEIEREYSEEEISKAKEIVDGIMRNKHRGVMFLLKTTSLKDEPGKSQAEGMYSVKGMHIHNVLDALTYTMHMDNKDLAEYLLKRRNGPAVEVGKEIE